MSIFSSSLGACCSLLCGLGGQPEVCLCLAVAGYLDEGTLLNTAGIASASWLNKSGHLVSPSMAVIVIKVLADDDMRTGLALLVWRTGSVCGSNTCMLICVQGKFLLNTAAGRCPGWCRGEPKGSSATAPSLGVMRRAEHDLPGAVLEGWRLLGS